MSNHYGAYSEFATAELTATAQIGSFGVGHPIYIHKMIVRLAATTPTITLRNGGAAGTLVLNAHIPTAGDIIEVDHYFADGCHYTEAGAITIQFWYR